MKCQSCGEVVTITKDRVSPNSNFIFCNHCGAYIQKDRAIKELESEKEGLRGCLENLALDMNEIKTYQEAIKEVDEQIKILKNK